MRNGVLMLEGERLAGLRPLGHLDQVVGAEPFGEGGPNCAGVQFDIAMSGPDGLVEGEPQFRAREPAPGDAGDACFRKGNFPKEQHFGLT